MKKIRKGCIAVAIAAAVACIPMGVFKLMAMAGCEGQPHLLAYCTCRLNEGTLRPSDKKTFGDCCREFKRQGKSDLASRAGCP